MFELLMQSYVRVTLNKRRYSSEIAAWVILTQRQRVTDGQTDRQTDRRTYGWIYYS